MAVLRRRRPALSLVLARVMLVIAVLLGPFGHVVIALPFSVGSAPGTDQAKLILSRVLPNIYRAFEFREESFVFLDTTGLIQTLLSSIPTTEEKTTFAGENLISAPPRQGVLIPRYFCFFLPYCLTFLNYGGIRHEKPQASEPADFRSHGKRGTYALFTNARSLSDLAFD